MKDIVIFYAYVSPKFLDKWEYYIADIEMLKETYKKVLFPKNIIELFLILIKNPKSEIYCWWWHRSFLVVLLAYFLKKRVYCTGAIHMYDYSRNITYYSRGIIFRFLTNISLRLSSYNIFISKDQYLSITSALKVNNPQVIYSSLTKKNNATNEETFLKECKIEKDEINLLFVGWLSEISIRRKSLLKVLDAIKIIRENIDNRLTFNICGIKSDALDLIKTKINDLSINENVKIHLNISQETKDNFYLRSDLLLTPSYMEGFGNSSLEAMSFGCPALVSRFGASPEVVGKTGYIINEINAESIADVIVDYAKLSYDEKLKMRYSAYQRAHTKFSFENKKNAFAKLVDA